MILWGVSERVRSYNELYGPRKAYIATCFEKLAFDYVSEKSGIVKSPKETGVYISRFCSGNVKNVGIPDGLGFCESGERVNRIFEYTTANPDMMKRYVSAKLPKIQGLVKRLPDVDPDYVIYFLTLDYGVNWEDMEWYWDFPKNVFIVSTPIEWAGLWNEAKQRIRK